ncbi:hypothetical protein JHK82_052477 [Glycine max]|nr:hypothetical protein JHK86_052321 [Glycine max]KAG5085080.1 hypothetical protein JHK82_052477 [Glycine max]
MFRISKMHAKGSNLGNSCKQTPGSSSSFVPNHPLQRDFDLRHQDYIMNQARFFFDWRKDPEISQCRNLIKNDISTILHSRHPNDQGQASVLANFLENRLFVEAASKDEYINRQTIMQRLDTQLKKLYAPKCSQVNSSIACTSQMVPSFGLLQARSNGSVPEPAFHNVAGPITNATNYCAVPVDNKNSFPNGGLSYSSFVPQPVFLPDNHPSIATCTDLDVLPNSFVSGGRSNLKACSKSISSYFPQRQADDWKTLLVKYGDCSRTTTGKSVQSESSNLMTPQDALREFSKVFDLPPVPRSLGDIRQHQHRKRDFQRNLKPFMQPYGLPGKTNMAQPNAFSNQGERCGQMLGHKTLKQPQLFKRSLNGDQQFTSGSSVDLFGLDDSDNMNSCGSSKVSVEQRIMLEYLYLKNFNNISRGNVMKYLHSTVCLKGTCNCGWYIKLLLHFDDCKDDGCRTCYSWKLHGTDILGGHLKFPDIMGSVERKNDAPSGNTEAMLPPEKRRKMEPAFGVPLINNASLDQSTQKMVHPRSSEALSELPLSQKADQEMEMSPNPTANSVHMEDNQGKIRLNQDEINATKEAIKPKVDEEKERKSPNPTLNTAYMEDIKGRIELDQDEINATKEIIEPKVDQEMERMSQNPTVTVDMEGIQAITGFNQDGINATKEVIEPKFDEEKERKSPNSIVNTADKEDTQGRTKFIQHGINVDLEMERKSSKTTVNTVSLIDFFTSNQIKEHITSLRKQFNQSTMVEESGSDVYTCQLCGMGTLSFAPVPIYCFCCGIRIKRNACYYYRREEDDTQHCFCSVCFRTSRGGNIKFNGTSVSKTDLDKKTNNREFEESWVECNKCKCWQHQICALYNDKRDLDYRAEYTCPICRLKEIGNGMHAPLPKTAAMFSANDLPRTMLSDHIESRLFKRLWQEDEDWAKAGYKNLDEVFEAESLSVRVVLSVDKQLKVKKQFLDIFGEENYPSEFPYTLKVILLFQKIEGVDVCLFAMYAQEFGSECGYPNQRSVYISYLDSVKYFRPKRVTKSGEALRTIVYHEILIGYLDFCKKRGFTTCYLWACPPMKGEDYLLYCHPDTQKTPKKDKLRQWYHSMLRKAAEENIVVGLTNLHDHFFVTTGSCDSKVTAARLPYFDGDFWSGAAMDKARHIEQECGGDYKMIFDKVVSKRCLKSMGHVNPPSEGTAKDILVMHKLGQTILPFKEDFLVVQFQYVCMHCHEVIANGKRWFCTECKKFQECERCHTVHSHISAKGERHRLHQVLMDDVLGDTKENDIILDNGLFDSRHNFLSFCQRNRFQFDSLRRAKYSSMMILYLVKNPTLLIVGTTCRVCSKNNVSQRYWKCENCPEFTVCSACYNERGASCHAHTLSEAYSPAQSPSGNQELQQNSAMLQQLLDVIEHASLCHSIKTQPCTYPHCSQIKKLFAHASRCEVRLSGGCQFCKKVWQGLTLHSRNCKDSACRIPRCMDLKKQIEWIATQAESRLRAAVLQSEDSR